MKYASVSYPSEYNTRKGWVVTTSDAATPKQHFNATLYANDKDEFPEYAAAILERFPEIADCEVVVRDGFYDRQDALAYCYGLGVTIL